MPARRLASAIHRDDCYDEDGDNYIVIILEGDEAAARSITHVEIPANGDYLPFHNRGGPGPTPFPDVRSTAAEPPDLEPVISPSTTRWASAGLLDSFHTQRSWRAARSSAERRW